jgi:hypothetical protein
MAKFVLAHPKLDVNGTNLEDHASSLEIITEFDEVELTSFCSNYREFGQGLGDATWTVDFFQDFASGEVDAILWPLSQSGGTFLLKASSGSAAVSATNPMFSMTARLFSYAPIAGAVGEASTTSVTFRNAGTAGLTRATTGSV